jgi:hypothetical protein
MLQHHSDQQAPIQENSYFLNFAFENAVAVLLTCHDTILVNWVMYFNARQHGPQHIRVLL